MTNNNEVLAANVDNVYDLFFAKHETAQLKVFRKRAYNPQSDNHARPIISNVIRLILNDENQSLGFATFDGFESAEDDVTLVFNQTGGANNIKSSAPVPIQMFNSILEKVISESSPDDISENLISAFYNLDDRWLTDGESKELEGRKKEYLANIDAFKSNVECTLENFQEIIHSADQSERAFYDKSKKVEDDLIQTEEYGTVKALEDEIALLQAKLEAAKPKLQIKRQELCEQYGIKEAEQALKEKCDEITKTITQGTQALIESARDQEHAELAAVKPILVDALSKIENLSGSKRRVKTMNFTERQKIIIKTGSAFFLSPKERTQQHKPKL